MALARCETCGTPQGLKHNYAHAHDQVSPPDKLILCGAKGCARLARIWLTDDEELWYAQGVRIFRVLNRLAARVS
jgi:hypothetical protein